MYLQVNFELHVIFTKIKPTIFSCFNNDSNRAYLKTLVPFWGVRVRARGDLYISSWFCQIIFHHPQTGCNSKCIFVVSLHGEIKLFPLAKPNLKFSQTVWSCILLLLLYKTCTGQGRDMLLLEEDSICRVMRISMKIKPDAWLWPQAGMGNSPVTKCWEICF